MTRQRFFFEVIRIVIVARGLTVMMRAGRFKLFFLNEFFFNKTAAGGVGRNRSNRSRLGGWMRGFCFVFFLFAAETKKTKAGGWQRIYMMRCAGVGICVSLMLRGIRLCRGNLGRVLIQLRIGAFPAFKRGSLNRLLDQLIVGRFELCCIGCGFFCLFEEILLFQCVWRRGAAFGRI